MTGIIVSSPPTVELPPGNSGSGPNSLPGVTYQYAVLTIPQTWTALQTYNVGTLALNGTGAASNVVMQETLNGAVTVRQLAFSDISGTITAASMPALTGDVTTSAGTVATTIAANAVTNAKAAQMAANTIKGNNTGSTANAADLTVAQAVALLASTYGARLAKTANYTALSTDNGSTIALGGSAFFTLTYSAASGYSATHKNVVVNEDTTRAKWIAPNGMTAFYLWPGQSIVVFNSNNVWQVLGQSRWKTPSGALTVNTDFTNGNDANDGLATGAGNAVKTVEGAMSIISNNFDLNGTGSPTQVTILMAAGSTDTQGVHQSFHSFVGANGGAAVKVDGNGGSITAAVQLYFGTVIQFRNITFSNAAGNCLQVFWGAKAYVLDAVTFGTCTGAHIQVASGPGHVELINNYTVSGGAAFHIIADTGGSVHATAALTVTISNSIAMTYWLLSASPAYQNMQLVTYNLNGKTVTCQKALAQLNGVILQSTSTLAVTGAVSGTAGVVRLTLASTASLGESQRVTVASVGGATGANGTFAIHIVDGTHIELTGSVFGGAYTSGGTVQIGLPGTTDASTSLGGQFL